MKLIMQNLLDNSWKFTSKISDAETEFGCLEFDGETVTYVKDNGAGFNTEQSDKLFATFQRLHETEDFEGFGKGLTTGQRIINPHGCRVWTESKVEEGSTIYFTIPD